LFVFGSVSRDRLGLCVDWLPVQAGDWGHKAGGMWT
jgi:hypothetical protein